MQFSFGIDLATLIIETVRQLVPDDATNCAVIYRWVCVGIEYGRLENAGGKNNIAQRTIVSVVRLWRHAPIGAIDRTAKTIDVKFPIRARSATHIADDIIVADFDLRVVARTVRVTDFDVVSVEFL